MKKPTMTAKQAVELLNATFRLIGDAGIPYAITGTIPAIDANGKLEGRHFSICALNGSCNLLGPLLVDHFESACKNEDTGEKIWKPVILLAAASISDPSREDALDELSEMIQKKLEDLDVLVKSDRVTH